MRNYLLYSNNTNLTASKNAWIKCFVFERIYVNINDSFHTTYIEERSCFISSQHIFPSLFKIPISISFLYLRIEWRQFAQKLFFFREHIQKHVRCRLPNVTRLLTMRQFKLNLRWYFCKQKGQVETLYISASLIVLLSYDRVPCICELLNLCDISGSSPWFGDCGDFKFSLLPNGLDAWIIDT